MIRRIGLHILFWLTYLFLKTYISVFLINYSYFDLDITTRILKGFLPELIVLPPKLLMAYYIMYSIIPRMNKRSTWVLITELLILIFISLVMYTMLLSYIVMPFIHNEQLPEGTVTENISRIIWRLLDMLTVVGAACTFTLLRKQIRAAKRQQELIQEKLQSELNYLRAQTNPHFLFNTLNSIYALARKQSPETSQVVMQLSKLMRYMLYDCREKLVPLENEWRVIEDYVELERLRYGDRVRVNLEKKVSQSMAMISPLMLLPIVENAFKHGAGNNPGMTNIRIELREENGNVQFKVENSIETTLPSQSLSDSSGIGLKNVKRQLELLYPEHSMEASRVNGTFTTTIKLHLHDEAAMPHR
jgi:sensor histidine kinase YesM